MTKKENQWRSVDASGHDWNSGEDFAPTPKQSATPTPQSVPQPTPTPQPVAQGAPTVKPSQPAAQSVPQSAAGLPAAVEQLRQTQLPRADTSAIRSYMERSRDAAVEQAAGQIDRGVTQSVNELRRVQEDAEEQYRTQRNQIDLDERRALDDRAAYDAARGVRGGIAGEQYSSIMNTAAQNRATLNNARTKLGTDTKQKMAELRANGEWEKAQNLLQASQQYLSQLAQLEQWEQEFNVGVEQFNAQMEQNYLNYLFQLRKMEIDTEQWEREFAANRSDAAWSQRFQQGQADTARDQWERGFAADRADTAWSQQFQQRQADTARDQWQQEFAANRSDAAWTRQFQQRQADTARDQWQQEFAANRSDAAWTRQFQQRQADTARDQWQQTFDADRSDTAWSQLFQQGQADFQRQQYADTRADTNRQSALSYAEAMMNVGMTPDEETLKAAGLSKEYAQLYISAVKAAQSVTGQAGSLSALAKAFVESGSENPKTWLAENYKAFGFASKPDFDEFEDAVDTARDNKESGIEENAGSGVNDRFYSFFEQRIQNALDDGTGDPQKRIEDVTAQIDRMWDKLSGPQRKALLKFLSRYGMSYEPD